MKNIKVGIKLIASYLIIAAVAMAVGMYLVSTLHKLDDRDTMMYEKAVLPLVDLKNLAGQQQRIRVFVRDVTLSRDAAEVDNVIKQVEDVANAIDASIEVQKKTILVAQNLEYLKAISENVRKYQNDLVKYGEFVKKNLNNRDLILETHHKEIEDLRVYSNAFGEASDKFAGTKATGAEDIATQNTAYATQAGNISTALLVFLFIFSVLVGIYMTMSITKPLNKVVETLKKGEDGDLRTLADVDQQDEIGIVAKSTNSFFKKLQHILIDLHNNSDSLANASTELSTVSRQLASGAEEVVGQSHTLASTAEQMSVNINAMASGAEEASVNANEVAGAAEQMSTNMNTIASAVEEMSASISQIASNTTEVRKVATEATTKSSEATSVMGKLGAAAKEIGQVTDVIKNIADKTNLLALNATIEAASAGEAGKGFAVVAGEIKELANQSAQSADDIARRIEGIQNGTGDAVKVIGDVSEIIVKINQSVEAIAGHVTQQTKASNEIASNVAQANIGAKRVASAIGEVAKGTNDVSRNAGEAAKGASNVSSNTVGMSQAAKDSAEGATQVSTAATDLSKIAVQLNDTVSQFKV